MIKLQYNTLTSDEWIYLRTSTSWTLQSKEVFDIAIKNSLLTVSAYCDDKIIGMGRMTGDNILSFFIQDIVVLPSYQNRGIGTLIVNSLIDYVYKHAVSSAVISLMASKGKEVFYKKIGFRERDGLCKGPGMELTIYPN